MATVIGFSELLITNIDKFPTEKVRSYLKLIYESSRNIHELLKNLLDWSRSQTGHISYTPDNLKLSLLASEIKYFMEETARNKQLDLLLESPPSVDVYADRNMIETVIRNLINNSIKFTKAHGIITVKIDVLNNKAVVSITDTGIGMDQFKVAKLFELGVKSNTKGTNNESGTGLGLLICREFLKYHGTDLFVESEPNVGSRFWFRLPLASNSRKNK